MPQIDAIKKKLSKKDTEDLLRMWTENNREKWRDEAFDAVRQILSERGMEPPEQTQFVPEKKKMDKIGVGFGLGGMIGIAIYRLSPDSPILDALFFGGSAGAIVGLIPYFLARARGHTKLGKASLIACIGSGIAFGLVLSAPLAAILSLVVVLRENAKATGRQLPENKGE